MLASVGNKITPWSHERCRNSFFFLDLVESAESLASHYRFELWREPAMAINPFSVVDS